MRALVLFDFDGTLACPTFSKDKHRMGVGDNSFIENFKNMYENHSILNLKPVAHMKEIIEKLTKKYAHWEFGVLSSCPRGSVEVFDKVKFLDKHYNIFIEPTDVDGYSRWQQYFFSTQNFEQKTEILAELGERFKDEFDVIIYVDDTLDTLIDAEKFLSSARTKDGRKAFVVGSERTPITQIPMMRFCLYHVTTFLSEFGSDNMDEFISEIYTG